MKIEALIPVYEQMQPISRCTPDRILCNPSLRSKYLELARNILGPESEEDLLWGLLALRKRKLLPVFGRADHASA